MNAYQKAATLVLRMIAVGLVALCALGMLQAGVLALVGQPAKAYSPGEWWASGFFIALGLVLLAAGKPIGRWIGKGLE